MISTLNSVREDFTSNLDDRGTKFSFMWIDANLHQDWVKAFGIEQFPSIVILNPGTKKRFVKHEAELITESSLASVLNSITGGNAKFTRVEENTLPLLKSKA